MSNGSWSNDAVTELTIPTGATTGERITINAGNDGAILLYNNADNLVASIAPAPGTDSGGNTYPNGVAVGVQGQGQAILGFNPVSETGFIYFTGPLTTLSAQALISVFTQGAGTAEQQFVAFSSPIDQANPDAVYLALYPSSEDGTALCRMGRAYKDTAGTFHFWEFLGYQGVTTNPGTINAPQPGTGTSRTNVAVAETWHNLSLNSPFTTNISPFAPARYRRGAENGGNVVKLSGVVSPTAGVAALTVIATVGTGYIPSFGQHISVATRTAAGVSSSVLLNVTNTGQVENILALGANDLLYLDNAEYVLD